MICFSLRGWPGPTCLEGVWSDETVSLVREDSGVHQDGTIGEQSDCLLSDLLLSLLLTLQIMNDLPHILGQFSQAEIKKSQLLVQTLTQGLWSEQSQITATVSPPPPPPTSPAPSSARTS